MKIVILMAGRGQRFAELASSVTNYAFPKPMVQVLNRPMVSWAVNSFCSFLQLSPNDTDKSVKLKDLIFICLREHEEEFQITSFLKNIFYDKINVLFAEEVTRGPAETALLARDLINSKEDVIISDCDHHFDARSMWNAISEPDTVNNVLGILPLMKPGDSDPTWSYVVLNARDEVIDIREKDLELAKKRAYGVIGAYYFRHGHYFVQEAQRMIDESDLVGDAQKEEFYMSRIYQRMIQRGFVVKSVFVNNGWLLGTPKHVRQFIETYQVTRGDVGLEHSGSSSR